MKGDLKLLVLKILQMTAATTTDLIDLVDYYSIHNTNKRFWGGMVKMPRRKPIFEKRIIILEKRQRIYRTISKLKKEGLVKGVRRGLLDITRGGKSEILKMEIFRDSKPNYEIVPSEEVKIITFDVPESRRFARKWLRDALKQLKFNMLQKSVWIGKSVIPEDFLEDLRERDLFDCVEILAVTKSGTLRQIQ